MGEKPKEDELKQAFDKNYDPMDYDAGLPEVIKDPYEGTSAKEIEEERDRFKQMLETAGESNMIKMRGGSITRELVEEKIWEAEAELKKRKEQNGK